MPDYQKGKIYKLWSPQGTEDEIYIGSTCNELRYRKSSHKKNNNKCQSKKLFEKYDDVRIELIEEYPCNNKEELTKKEGEYIRNNKCLNRRIPNRTAKEHYQDNKELIKLKSKEYRDNHKQVIAEKAKEYREINKEKKAEYNKEYNKNNKEARAEKNKEYYQNNKKAIAERTNEKVTCECGCIIRKDSLARHQKSIKHINALTNK